MKSKEEIAEIILDQFKKTNSRVGHIVAMRIYRHSIIPKLNPKEQDIFMEVIKDLAKADFLLYEDGDSGIECLRLTEKGFERIYSDTSKSNSMTENKINIEKKIQQPTERKKKFKMELSHKIGLGSLIVATTVLLFGNNILGRLNNDNYIATKDSASTFIKDSILSLTTKAGSPNINPVISKSNNLPILTIPLQNFKQKDSILGHIRKEKKLRPLTTLESGQSISALPNNSYSYISAVYLNIDSNSETYNNIFKYKVDRFNNYPNLMYEVHKISNDEIYLVGFISQESASKISNTQDNFVLAEKPININDNIALIPLNQIINSSDRTIQIDKENEMIILDIKIK